MIALQDLMADVRATCGDYIVDEVFVVMERMLSKCRFQQRLPISDLDPIYMVDGYIIEFDPKSSEILWINCVGNGRLVWIGFNVDSGLLFQRIYKTKNIISIVSSVDMNRDSHIKIVIDVLCGCDTQEVEIIAPWDEKVDRFFELLGEFIS